jgi:putative salt-induced outer membrane protein YdiY
VHKQYLFLLALLCSSLTCITNPSAEEAVATPPTAGAPVTEQNVDTPPDPEQPFTTEVFSWENSTPTATDFDWVQLTSGEWLKGEIKGLYKDTLEFESDILDDLELDWSDVKYLVTHIPGNAYIEGRGTVYGYFEISDNKLIVSNGGKKEEFGRSRLVSFVTGGEKELDYWSAKITLGLNVRSGNTDQVDYNSKINLKRQTSFSRFILDYIGNISITSDVETSNNHRVSASHDIFKTRYFFLRPIFGQYFRDPFQNIDAEVTIGTGLGYTIVDTSDIEWDVFGGPAYQSKRFVSVAPGEDNKETTPALVLGTNYENELTGWLDFIFKYNTIWGNKASGGYTHHLETTFESELIASFDLDITFMWDHISSPTPGDDGVIPENDDYRMILGISYEY